MRSAISLEGTPRSRPWEPATVQLKKSFNSIRFTLRHGLTRPIKTGPGEEAQAMLEKHQEVIANQPLSTDRR